MRGDDEVVLQLALVAVVEEIDPGIDSGVAHLGVSGNVAAPLGGVVADEVVGCAGERVSALDLGAGAGAHQVHSDDIGLEVRRIPLGG